jgi:hypothetical protein
MITNWLNPQVSIRQTTRPGIVMTPTDPTPLASPLRPDQRRQFARTRVGVLVIATTFATIALLSMVGFVFNLAFKYPGTDSPVIQVDPLWMAGHLVRALALGWLAFRLWCYHSALKRWRDGGDADPFLRAQSAAWVAGAIAIVVLMGYAVLQVAFTTRW